MKFSISLKHSFKIATSRRLQTCLAVGRARRSTGAQGQTGEVVLRPKEGVGTDHVVPSPERDGPKV